MKYKITVSERKVYEFELESTSRPRARLAALREFCEQKDMLLSVKECLSLDHIEESPDEGGCMIHKSMIMSSSMGPACPNCYDEMSD